MARKSNRNVERGALTQEEADVTGQTAVTTGGFSTRTTGRGSGRPARNVLSTGFAPESGRGAEVPIDTSQSPGAQVMQFNQQNRGMLATPGANMAQGGWWDPDNSQVVQDTSVLTPKSRGGIEAAMSMASEGGQYSIGNVGSKAEGYIGDIILPEDIRRRNDHFVRGVFHDHPWNENTFGEPSVTRTGNKTTIIPSRKEMASVEAGLVSEKMNLPEGDQYTKAPLSAQEYIDKGNKKRK